MGFSSGSKIIADIIEEIANGLIAAGYWQNITSYDPGATAWTTATKTGDSAKRALRYVNGSEEIFLSITAVNTYRNFYPSWYGKGLEIVFSQTWDSSSHNFPSSNHGSFIPFESMSSAGVNADMATLQIQYYLWIESNGFVITGKPEPFSDNQQMSFFLVVERNPNKEYTDGYSNFYSMNRMNNYEVLMGDGYYTAPNNIRARGILRPFAYVYPPSGAGNSSYTITGNGVNNVVTPSYYAFKSTGNGKVYYVKPIINNAANALTPIFQAELWFPWTEGVGLIDGDVIAIEGSTTKYLCKALDSPDYTSRIPIAIKYVA